MIGIVFLGGTNIYVLIRRNQNLTKLYMDGVEKRDFYNPLGSCETLELSW